MTDRRTALWEVGLRYRPASRQQALELPVEQDLAQLPGLSRWETMEGEYQTLSLYPRGHLMAMLRPHLPAVVLTSQDVQDLPDGMEVNTAGLVIRRQRPLGKAVFITLEDEYGHIPLVVWPKTYERLRQVLQEPVVMVRGIISRQEGTMNIVVQQARQIKGLHDLPRARNWN